MFCNFIMVYDFLVEQHHTIHYVCIKNNYETNNLISDYDIW